MKRFLTLLLCVAMMAGCAVLLGCEKDVGGGKDITDSETTLQKETEPPAPPSIELAVDGETAYKVICSEDSDTDVTEFSNELCRYLSEISGAQFRLISDFAGRKADPDAVSEYEILIGGTNRTADDSSLECAGNDGWCVSAVGSRIVINAQSVYSLAEAIEYFKSIVKAEDGKMSFELNASKVMEKNIDLNGLTLRVGTYNIKHGAVTGLDFKIIAEDIKALDLDIVGFQEIDKYTSRVSGLDTPKIIAKFADYDYYYFSKAIDYKGGEYGTLILSRYPIEFAETIQFPFNEKYESRSLGHALIDIDGYKLHFFNTHMNNLLATEQFAVIAEHVNQVSGYILTGDFNLHDPIYFEPLRDHLLVNNQTYKTTGSGRYIDNIVLDSKIWKITDAGVVNNGHSDHNLLWAEVKMEIRP